MLLTLANTYRELLNYERDPSKLKRGYGGYEVNSMIEREPSNPGYSVLFERANAVVPLFDYLYFELRRVQTPAVKAFIEPFGKCYSLTIGTHCNAHIGAELDAIGDMWGTSVDVLFKAARLALETDIANSAPEFDSVLSMCEHRFNLDATAGEGAIALFSRVVRKHTDCLLEIKELKARLVLEEAKAKTLGDIKDKASMLSLIQPLLGKRQFDLIDLWAFAHWAQDAFAFYEMKKQ